MTNAQTTPLLITVPELAQRLSEPGLVIVDCRFNLAQPDAGEAAYRSGHIPGAFYAHLDRDLSSRRTPESGRHPLPQADALAQLFSGWGVTPQTQVVAYDDAGGAIAARLWWLLRWMGHGSVSLLDGGLAAWRTAGLPLSAEIPAPRPVAFIGAPGHMPVIATGEIEQQLDAPQVILFDARSRARYRGEEETIDPVAGHVPGAVSVPFQESLAGDARFRSPHELRPAFDSAAQGKSAGEIAVMCGSGVTACHGLFAMELAGLRGARLYAGSWSEWIRSPERPVARGDDRGGRT